MLDRDIATTTLLTLLFHVGCTSHDQQPVPHSYASETAADMKPPDRESKITRILEAIALRLEKLEKWQDWNREKDQQWLALQGMTAEARQYEIVLTTITASTEPDERMLECLAVIDPLQAARVRAESLLKEPSDLAALADTEIELDTALLKAKSCVVNYGEVAFVYFKLDRQGDSIDGRTVPNGLNPRFQKENNNIFSKIGALCSRDGVIHLYGYSCDLGAVMYDEALAYERALNVKYHISYLLSSQCDRPNIRIEAHLGGIVDLIDPNGTNPELIESQREHNRVVAAFIFNQP